MKKCLVICPFGRENTPARDRSDYVYEEFIVPAANEEGYEAYRAIDTAAPGDITLRVIKELYEADLVIADLTDLNPNVLYELALRHSVAKPFIQISETTENLPFDLAVYNVIKVKKSSTFEEGRRATAELRDQMRKIREGSISFDNHASRLRPNSDLASPVRAYRWSLTYTGDLATNWLQLQGTALRKFVQQFEKSGGTPKPHLRNIFAEYMAYKLAQGTRLWGDLYFVKDVVGNFTGWGIFAVQGSSPISIQIHGLDVSGRLTVYFSQPARKVCFEPDIQAEIRPFDYTVEFVLNGNAPFLDGELYHPEFPKGDKKLLVAKTTLTPNPGSALSR